MSRSGYTDDYGCDDQWGLIMYRGQVASAIRGKRGQAFLRELIEALDAMPEKRLIAGDLIRAEPKEGDNATIPAGVCAIGALGVQRGVNVQSLDPEDYDKIASVFGVARQLVQELEYENDEGWHVTPEARWINMRAWAIRHIKETA